MAASRQLFHTIVVIGASLGCGGVANAPDKVGPAGTSPASGTADAAVTPGEGGADASHDCATCTDAALSPRGICDCARAGEFRCASCPLDGDPPVDGRCLSGDGSGAGAGCFCDTSVAVAAPGDCAHTEQFTCGSFFGPLAYTSCTCDPSAPLSPSDCAPGTAFQCQGAGNACPDSSAADGGLVLGGESPRFACFCGPPPVPIR